MSLVSNNVFRLIFKDTILDYDSINNILKILRETEQKIWIDENGCMKWIPWTIIYSSYTTLSILDNNEMEDEYYENHTNRKICKYAYDEDGIQIYSRWCDNSCCCDYTEYDFNYTGILEDWRGLYDERIDGPYGCEESMRIEFLEDPNSGHCCYANMIGYYCNCGWIWRNGPV